MKKLGIAVVIFLVALLVTGVASALDTTKTTDGQTLSVKTIKVGNITPSGDHMMIVTGQPEKTTFTQTGPGTAVTSDGQIIKRITIKVENLTSLVKPGTDTGKPQEIFIRRTGPETWMTSTGETFHLGIHFVSNETDTGSWVGDVRTGQD